MQKNVDCIRLKFVVFVPKIVTQKNGHFEKSSDILKVVFLLDIIRYETGGEST